MVKVVMSKNENLASRLHDVVGVFSRDLEIPKEDLIGDISLDDAPENALRKAKSIDNIVFIVKVHDIGTAESDVRDVMGTTLEADFIKSFTTHIEGKELNSDGMTEWILTEARLVEYLRWKFRYDQLVNLGKPDLFEQLSGQ